MSKEGKLITLKNAIQLKIVLKQTKPAIWRRIVVENSITFFELHHIIQCVMGWENAHLYEFMVDNYRIGEPNGDFDSYSGSKMIDSEEIALEEVLSSEIKKFSYDYDFGDGWDHEIIIEKILPLDHAIEYPKCLKGKMNCPPEDCGGIPGYYNLVEIMKNKKHPERKEMIEWLGGVFDPMKFDLEGTNAHLSLLSEALKDSKEDLDEDDLLKGEFFDDDDDDWDDEYDLLGLLPDVPIKVVNKSKHDLPHYETEASAGMDLRANIEKNIRLKPLERALVKTGLYIELPIGFEAQVRPRSGLAIKHGITVLNAPGTVDADYRGEIGVILVNLSSETYLIEDGARIAQLVIAHHERGEWEEVKKLGDTDRGEGGFGSTGKS